MLEAAVPSEIDARRLGHVMIARDPGRAADITRSIIDGGCPRASVIGHAEAGPPSITIRS